MKIDEVLTILNFQTIKQYLFNYQHI